MVVERCARVWFDDPTPCHPATCADIAWCHDCPLAVELAAELVSKWAKAEAVHRTQELHRLKMECLDAEAKDAQRRLDSLRDSHQRKLALADEVTRQMRLLEEAYDKAEKATLDKDSEGSRRGMLEVIVLDANYRAARDNCTAAWKQQVRDDNNKEGGDGGETISGGTKLGGATEKSAVPGRRKRRK